MLKISDWVNLDDLRAYDFEVGWNVDYEIWHVRDFEHTSWSLCVDENTREIYIQSYKFDDNEENVIEKKVNDQRWLRHYIYKYGLNKFVKQKAPEEVVVEGQMSIFDYEWGSVDE